MNCWCCRHVVWDQKGLTCLPPASPSPPANITNTLFSLLFVVYPHPQRQFHEYHAVSFFLYLSRRSLHCLRVLSYILAPHHPNPLCFFISQSSESQRKCLIYWLVVLYYRKKRKKESPSDHPKQSRIHSQLQRPIPFSSNELLSSLKNST